MLNKFFASLVDPDAFEPIAQPPDRVLDFFRYYLKPFWRLLLVTLLLVGITTASELLLYVYLGQLIDWMSNTQPSDFFAQYSLPLIGMLIVTAIIRPITLLASRGLISFAITVGISNTIRWHNHRYVVRQSLNYFQNDFAGRIAQKVMQTGNAVREAILSIIDGLWLLVIYLLGIIWLFIEMDWRLLLPTGLWIIAYTIVIIYTVPPVRQRSAALSEANSQWLGQIVDSYTNIQSVKLFTNATHEDAHMRHYLQAHTHAFHQLIGSIFNMTVMLTILNTLLIISTIVIAIDLWHSQVISIGSIATASAVIMRINQMSGWILRTITSLFENIGTVQNSIHTLSKPNRVMDVPDASDLQLSHGQIDFQQVQFNYYQDTSIIQDFNLRIKAGEKIGIVGRSGAGKSTLVNLLLRFHDLDAGSIQIDGQNIAHITQQSLRAHIAMVTQDTALLHRSVRDNIRYGQAHATEEAILRVVELAGVSSFLPQLVDPQGRKGLDALVGERGVKLSGGQRQRIAIARAMLKDAPILILDEATSALDSEVEAVIQSRLQTLMINKTVLAIAHRLSTIAAMDRLVVIDQGRIIEQGTHQTLLANNGLYAQLWRRQSGGFLASN